MKKQITAYGKQLRILRMNNGELLKDMADKLAVTSSYLSAIENGKRNIPKDFTEKIASIYKLSDDAMNELKAAEEESLTSITLNLEDVSTETQDLVVAFAKKFDKLDSKTIANLRKYLK